MPAASARRHLWRATAFPNAAAALMLTSLAQRMLTGYHKLRSTGGRASQQRRRSYFWAAGLHGRVMRCLLPLPLPLLACRQASL